MESVKELKNMIPVTIITGFLGSGKTTLLNKILKEQHGNKLAVIENEFGSENIDTEILVHDTNEEIVELSNGCVCCTIRGDLIKTLSDLYEKLSKKQLDFERIIIETTGLADPGPLCQTFFINDYIANHYKLDSLITLVDAKHAPETLNNQIEAQKQVGFADIILISKSDLVPPENLNNLKQRLIKINPKAPIKILNIDVLDINYLLNISGFNLDSVLDIDPSFLQSEDHTCTEECHHHHHDGISSFVFQSYKPFDPEKLENFLSQIVQKYGTDMLRYKGILYMKGIENKILFQGVHMIMGAEPAEVWAKTEKPNNKIVFIGQNLPKDMFIQGLELCLIK
ncbi:G3E family GTPase [Candidatus Kinetoplastibacterium desouzaii TCC079E]|uniref:G3E family GTPase n=1 Tax=Candidatus Kinetoplastidibacterium desouzai TCC079E TaxID=1208919 RepID=M1LNG3_9PROT|nr:GTP-binding protein [Candidatus Kinetoplastibacterium desouzaii]AGF47232.1 G3E family GTPase [Candidatus Kinetoplastibacterium desouzaii TCC079E]